MTSELRPNNEYYFDADADADADAESFGHEKLLFSNLLLPLVKTPVLSSSSS